ncbi:MAG: LysR family transcriptional regulator [Bacteriovoracia bacterium]
METISRNLDELLAFHTVASHGSFTQAADALGTSKAMLSKKVRRLETHLRAQLFHRTTRSLALTQPGQALLNYSRKIMELSIEASKQLNAMNQGDAGILRLTAPALFGQYVFDSLLPALGQKLPRVKFELDLSNEERNLYADDIDFAIRLSDLIHPELIAAKQGRMRDAVCATPKFLRNTKLGADPETLSKQECILSSHRETWNEWRFRTPTGVERSVIAKGRYATNSYASMRALALAHLGILRIPYYLVARDIAEGNLVELFREHTISTHAVYLVYRQTQYPSKKHQIARDALNEWFREHDEIFV